LAPDQSEKLSSLLVALDGLLIAHLCRVGVGSELSESPALVEKIPALVEFDLDILKSGLLLFMEPSASVSLPQRMFLVDKLADLQKDLGIRSGHSFAPLSGPGCLG
jgi:hypothetical protein